MTPRPALTHALRAVELRLRELGDPTPADPHGDAADQLAAREEHERQVLGRAELTERRRLILLACEKVDRGEYGRCEACGQLIAAKRLAGTPWVVDCLLCASQREQAAQRNAQVRIEPPIDEGQA